MLTWLLGRGRIRMATKVRGKGEESLLIGTAHFTPYDFRTDLRNLLAGRRKIYFEAPLDGDSLNGVLDKGRDPEAPSVLDLLTPEELTALAERIVPRLRADNPLLGADMILPDPESETRRMTQGMKPWLTFFTLWSAWLANMGWRGSVDLQALEMARSAGQEVGWIETIDEQIAALDTMPVDGIVRFLRQAPRWPEIARNYAKGYLAGDSRRLNAFIADYPSRTPEIIDRRDQVFHDRLRTHLDEGGLAVCVGAAHIPGLLRLLAASGFTLTPAV